jgi:hypothetical protein
MADQAKFGILRRILRTLGLSEATTDDLIEWISASLAADQSTKGIATPHYPYRRRDEFLSPAERSFFGVLNQVVGISTLICPKVNLADLFYVPSRDASEYRVYTNKIDRKHVDFVLCDPMTLMPILGIELDDRSHQRADRQQRDHLVDNVFAAAGLPLVRVPVKRGYAVQEIAELLHDYLPIAPGVSTSSVSIVKVKSVETLSIAESGNVMQINVINEAPSKPASRICLKCGNEMVLRTARSGANAGQQFWGCANYPKCRAMVAYETTNTAV